MSTRYYSEQIPVHSSKYKTDDIAMPKMHFIGSNLIFFAEPNNLTTNKQEQQEL